MFMTWVIASVFLTLVTAMQVPVNDLQNRSLLTQLFCKAVALNLLAVVAAILLMFAWGN